MRKVADSLLLAVANVLISGVAFVCLRTRGLDFLGLFGATALVPVVLLATLIYVVRDLVKGGRRMQAVVAVIVSVIPAVFRLTLEI